MKTEMIKVSNGTISENMKILGWEISTTPAGEIRMLYREDNAYRCVMFSKKGQWVETRGTGEPGSEDMKILGSGNLVRAGVPFTGNIRISDEDINYRWWVYEHDNQIDIFMRDHNINELIIVDGPLDQFSFIDRFVDREGYRCATKIYSDEPMDKIHPDHGRVDTPLSECSDADTSEHTYVYRPSSNSLWVEVYVCITKGGEELCTRTVYLKDANAMRWYDNGEEYYSN